jgi:acetyl esterase/lipase
MKRLILFLVSFSLLGSACQISTPPSLSPVPAIPTSPPQNESSTNDAFDKAKLGSSAKDITYCTMDGTAIKLDIYYPAQFSAEPWPVVMYVHGGAWQKGDKSEGAGFRSMAGLQSAGFLVVAVNYRLAPQYPFPAQIQDVKCAVRYLRANAVQYHLEPGKIGVWGGSAGGHLSALLGTSDGTPGWDVGEYLDQSSRVQAVVDMFGPADLSVEFDASNFQTARAVFGAVSKDDPKLEAASPVTYIDPGDPPFLILHGDLDRTVPLEQSQILVQRLQDAGVSAQLVIVHGAGHGFAKAGGQPISPSLVELNQQVVDFFVSRLKR